MHDMRKNKRYSIVGPKAILRNALDIEVMRDTTVLGNYLLFLAHDVLENAEWYEHFVEELRLRYHDDLFIIMDNGVVELGEPLPVIDVVEAGAIVEASCIATPDVLRDMKATEEILLKNKVELVSCNFPLLRIPQGANNAELATSVRFLRDHFPALPGDKEYWGVPRWIATEIGSRIPITQFIGATAPQMNAHIHLLGMSENFEDDMRSCMLPDVIGIDSANPVVLGQLGTHIDVGEYKHVPRNNYWNDTELTGAAVSNIMWMHNAVGRVGFDG